MFYRHNPLPHFITISINFFLGQSSFSVELKERSSRAGFCGLMLQHPPYLPYGVASCSLSHDQRSPPQLTPPRTSSCVLMDMIQAFRDVRGRGRRVLKQFTDDESLSSGQCVFTAQSLNSAGLSIRPLSIWLADSQRQIGQ